MNRYKLKDISLSKLEYGSGAAACEYDGKTRYVRITDIDNEGNLGTDVVSPNSVDDKYLLNDGDVLFARTGATVGKTYLYRSSAGRCIYAGFLIRVVPNQKIIRPDYLYYFTKSPQYKGFVQSSMKIVAQPNINAKQYGDLEFNVPSLEEQDLIIKKLNTISSVIILRRTELIRLDELIKARFVEMFGDPVINSFGIETKPMTEVCEIIDGDRGKNYPTTDEFSDEGYCLFLNAKNVTSTGFNFDTCMFVTKEKDEILRNGKLLRGDVVLTTRGTLGNLAFYTEDIPFEHVRINSGMVILRMRQNIVDEVYFIEQFKMQLSNIKEKIASGSAQPQLPISTMNKINILIPHIEEQRRFAVFVHQIDKSRVAVQKALDETQLLFDSLMQKYFG